MQLHTAAARFDLGRIVCKAVNFAGRGDSDIAERVELGVVEDVTRCFVRRRAGKFDQESPQG
jgi:hypothetical protein